MLIQKKDLAGTHYDWTDERNHLYSGEPSRRIFDRYNGNQVLFIINFIASLIHRFSTGDSRRIEHSIQFELPPEVKSEISVFYWIKNSGLFFSK